MSLTENPARAEQPGRGNTGGQARMSSPAGNGQHYGTPSAGYRQAR
jgi:hypothetical protein